MQQVSIRWTDGWQSTKKPFWQESGSIREQFLLNHIGISYVQVYLQTSGGESCKQSNDLSGATKKKDGVSTLAVKDLGICSQVFPLLLDVWLQNFYKQLFLDFDPKAFFSQQSIKTSVPLTADIACLEYLTFWCWTFIYASDISPFQIAFIFCFSNGLITDFPLSFQTYPFL